MIVTVAAEKFASVHDPRHKLGDRWAARVIPADLPQLLRHESIETTMRYYVKRNAETLSESIRRGIPDAEPCVHPYAILANGGHGTEARK